MGAENLSDKYSLKNLLFSRCMPNYVVPLPTAGFKIYPCIDCGDKYMFQSSYEYHVNRKSCKITFVCSLCSNKFIFYNRCKLLAHIRSHCFKTATINVKDLSVEPLPLYFLANTTPKLSACKTAQCYDCGQFIPNTGNIFKDRASHYMKYTTEVHTCPVCLFKLPTQCGLKTHLRLHLKQPPCFCPECGVALSNKDLIYPFNHHCEGFNIMRVTKRYRCPIKNCITFHPNQYMEHMRNHLRIVYKCSDCYVACYTIEALKQHTKTHKNTIKPIEFYQCKLCPGRLVLNNQTDNHLKTHFNALMSTFPCWNCGMNFVDCSALLAHCENKVCKGKKNVAIGNIDTNNIYRVVKRCDKCCQSFTYRCRKEEIDKLPVECPYKCLVNASCFGTVEPSPGTLNPSDGTAVSFDGNAEFSIGTAEPTGISDATSSAGITDSPQLVCQICKEMMSCEWEQIKEHFASHPSYKCLDIKVVVEKIDVSKYINKTKLENEGCKIRKRNRPLKDVSKKNAMSHKKSKDNLPCSKCNESFDCVENYEKHIILHRDPCTAYQCMECAECFVSKPSFSKHLLLKHKIDDVNEYISKKPCYNENALDRYQDAVSQEPVKENQCNICKEQFSCQDDFEKHFRMHGMAFLQKTRYKSSP